MRNPVKQLIFVSVAIIGFLAYAMHEVEYNNLRAHISEAVLDCSQVKSQIDEFAMKNGKLPGSMNALQPPPTRSKYVKSIDVLDDATIVATLQGEEETDGKRVFMHPVLEGGIVTWICGTPNENFWKYVPAECRHKLQPDRASHGPAASNSRNSGQPQFRNIQLARAGDALHPHFERKSAAPRLNNTAAWERTLESSET